MNKNINDNNNGGNTMKINYADTVIGPVRFSYARLMEAVSTNGGKPKYSASLIISKDDTASIEKVNAAIQAAYENGESKLKGSSATVPPLSSIKTPLRDGDVEKPHDSAYANAYFLNASSASAPGIVNADNEYITDPAEVYSGMYGLADINFYAYSVSGSKGIACSLNNVQKLQDGERLGGKRRAVDVFTARTTDDDFLD